MLHLTTRVDYLNIINLFLIKKFDLLTKNSFEHNVRKLVPNAESKYDSKMVEAVFFDYTSFQSKKTVIADWTTDEKSTTNKNELDAIQVDDNTTTPAVRLILITFTSEISVAESSNKKSTRSPFSKTPAIVIDEIITS